MLSSADVIRKWLPSISRDLDLRCKVCDLYVCVFYDNHLFTSRLQLFTVEGLVRWTNIVQQAFCLKYTWHITVYIYIITHRM